MMNLYAINYALMADTDLEFDRHERCLDVMAAPQVAALATDETLLDQIEEVKQAVLVEFVEAVAEVDENGEAVEPIDGLAWTAAKWNYPDPGYGRPNLVFDLIDEDTREIVARLIVQKVEGI